MKKLKLILLFSVAMLMVPVLFWEGHVKLVNGENEEIIKTKIYATVELPEVEKEHYIFKGWFSEGKRYNRINGLMGNKELRAEFEPKSYRIKYEFNGATNIKGLPYEYKYNEELPLVNLEKENYVFEGYKINGEVTKVIKAGTYGNLLAEAVFSPREYNIIYELNGGTTNSPASYKYGEEFALGNANKQGYTFDGWYWDENFEQKFAYNKELSGDIKVFAKFSKIEGGGRKNLALPYVSCGSYGATLVTHSNPTTESVQAVTDGPGAWHEYVYGREYIADHNFQGATAFITHDTLSIYREDGSVDIYDKANTTTIAWGSIGVSIIGTIDGELVTQTCQGDDVVLSGWYRR